jgi:hypothetical protein
MRPTLLAVAVALASAPAAADNACHVVDVAFTPTDGLQIVAWVEKTDGTYLETIYITRKTGHYGLGNRPGRFDFNSGPPPGPGKDDMWPYGRRSTLFPVWAHRHGKTFPEVEFQRIDSVTGQHTCCGNDNDLSQQFEQSSPENPPYCRPTVPGENDWDTATCASQSYTDKGIFSPTKTSLYPPRADVVQQPDTDSTSVAMYKQINPFDAVSQATPVGGACARIEWPIPPALSAGSYVMWLEVAQEFDFNSTYNPTSQPPPCGGSVMPCTMPAIPYFNYGQPYRGQPSVVYQIPFTIATGETTAAVQTYGGYGDPSGASGALHPPDGTITTDTPGSGASRLMLIAGSSDRVRVMTRPETDALPPAAPASLTAVALDGASARIQFTAPGDDGLTGSVSGYEIHIRANDEMTVDNFADSMPVTAAVSPGTDSDCGGSGGYPAAGTMEAADLTGLLPETDYWVGVRAFDKCHNVGDLAIVHFTTPERKGGYVGWCFVATAAYGSAMANDVEMLRRFRDLWLESTVLGELAVETYYTFGPTLAGVIDASELARAAARDVLRPVIARVRSLSF